MRIVLISILCFTIIISRNQDTTAYSFLNESNNGVMPRFQGGEEQIPKIIAENMRYPLEARERGVQGTVYISFTIEKDGSMSNVTLLFRIGGGCDEEALRVVRLLNGKWTPGTIDGKPVRVKFTIPIKFILNDPNSKDPAAAYNKGLNLLKEEKYEKAMSYFSVYKPGEKLYPDATYALGLCRFQTADYKEAIAEWEKAKAAGHQGCELKLAEAYLKLGNQYNDKKMYPAAISCFDKALENSPNDINVLYNRGISYLLLGIKDKACGDWQSIKDLGSAESQQLLDEYCK